MSEPLTPTKFSTVKVVSGSNAKGAYSFNSVGFLTREHGDKKWFNFAFNGENPLKEGQTYELDVKQRPYTDKKDGSTKIAYDAKKPNAMADFAKTIMALSLRVSKLEEFAKKFSGPVVQQDEDVPPPSDDDFQGEPDMGL